MSRALALLLVAAVSFSTPLIMLTVPQVAQEHATTLTTLWAALGIIALAAISDGRLTPWFARLGGRLFLGRNRGLWLSLAFTLLLMGASAAWAWRLIDAKFLDIESLIGMLVLFVLVLAPWEELWWRGVWFAAATRLYWTQVLLGSCLFALGHGHRAFEDSEAWIQLIVLFLSGVAFASLRRVGAPLVLLMLLHGFANVTVRLTALAGDQDALFINGTIIAMGVMGVICILAGFGHSHYEPNQRRRFARRKTDV